MDAAADMTDRHARLLGRLAEIGMAVAEDLAARVLAAETAQDAAALASSLHKLSRSVRQSLALEARLSRDAVRAAADAERADAVRAHQRKELHSKRVRQTVSRLIWTEHEDDDAEDLTETLDNLLYAAELEDDFGDTPLEVLAARFAAELGLQGPTLQGEVGANPPEGVEVHAALRPKPPPTPDAEGLNSLNRPPPTAPPEGAHPAPEPAVQPPPAAAEAEEPPNPRASWREIFLGDDPLPGVPTGPPGEFPP